MPAYFITSSGTDIGKTFVTTSLCRQITSEGKKVSALKPLMSGWEPSNPEMDTLQILAALGKEPTEESINEISPWRFAAPLTPSMAAKKEGKTIDFAEVITFCQSKIEDISNDETLLIEGAGGVMAPITDEHTYLDLMKALNIPVIVVVGSYLGSISHTLTAIKTLESNNISALSLVVSESDNSSVSFTETIEALKKFTSIPLHPVTRSTSPPSKLLHLL